MKNPKISYLLQETLVFSIICSKCGGNNEKIFNEEKGIEILKFLYIINNKEMHQNMAKENISQNFRSK